MSDKEEELKLVHEWGTGYCLYRKVNEVGGHSYISDRIGGGSLIWDTCCADQDELLMAIALEQDYQKVLQMKKRMEKRDE